MSGFGSSNSWMMLYELDPWDEDELVQSLYFPTTGVGLSCNAWSCGSATTPWVSPNSYDTPTWPPLVDTQMAIKVNWGSFVDTGGV